MTPLEEILARRIRATGPLTLAEFMAEALHHPGAGYYATRDPLGAAGDFVTAPEVSQVFGELLGLWCADAWMAMGGPDPVLLAELGPGRGTLMADALRALKVTPAFGRALRLHLIETSPVLRAAQAKTLADAAPTWHEGLDTLPDGPLLLLANEFLDALPIRQFERRATGWHERRVGLAQDGAGLAFALDPQPSAAAGLIPRDVVGAPLGSIAEARPAALGLGATLGARLARAPGYALFIDYGHAPSAPGDTLQAVRGHRRHPVLEAPGSADLTAHVDFAAFAAAAGAAGARAYGPVTQRDLLEALGIHVREQRLLARASPDQASAIRAGIRRLIDPAEMGTLFKVLALAHPALPQPVGFPEDR